MKANCIFAKWKNVELEGAMLLRIGPATGCKKDNMLLFLVVQKMLYWFYFCEAICKISNFAPLVKIVAW
jgi:hypothetical protein